MTGFGVTNETQGRNKTPFGSGFTKSILMDVVSEEIGKTEKYTVLNFSFVDIEGIKTHKHTEFALKETDPKYAQKMGWMNSRIKHLFETYAKFPDGGIGTAATNFKEYFDQIAVAFNTSREGKKIYTTGSGTIESPEATNLVVWTKLTYDTKGQIGFPLMPNFIERISATNQDKPKSLSIDLRYDNLEQKAKAVAQPDAAMGGIHQPTGDLNF